MSCIDRFQKHAVAHVVVSMFALLPSATLQAQRVVRETHEQWRSARTLTVTPTTRWCADGDAPGCDFKRPPSVRLTPDGGLLVSDITGPLRYFAANGAFVRELGRKGQGPGEYGFVVEAHVARNGLVTWFDNTQMRFATVALDGKPGPVTRLMPPQTMANLFVLDSELVILDVPAAPKRGTMVDGAYRTIPALGASRTLARVRTPSVFESGSDMQPVSGPFRPRVVSDVSDAGDVAHSNGVAFDIEVFPSSGAPWRLQVDRPTRPVTAAERDSVRNAAVVRYKVANIASLPAPLRDAYEQLPDTHPPLWTILLCTDGTLWIRPVADRDATRARWDVFQRNGTRVGQALLPMNARLRDCGSDWILTDELNADDVVTFVRYRVGR
jgi:hypothetical protein